jgi:cell wall-associated NlpC family hydrolase
VYIVVIAAVLSGCVNRTREKYLLSVELTDSSITEPSDTIITGNIKAKILVEYAHTLIGTPYLYGSTDPSAGFDCSGFITYVFNHFHIEVPRSSIGFTNVGKEVVPVKAMPGDLILFTGTDTSIRDVGHMGIIVSNVDGNIKFIHATSGRAKAVVITSFESYYYSRFVKVIRIFPDNRKSEKSDRTLDAPLHR